MFNGLYRIRLKSPAGKIREMEVPNSCFLQPLVAARVTGLITNPLPSQYYYVLVDSPFTGSLNNLQAEYSDGEFLNEFTGYQGNRVAWNPVEKLRAVRDKDEGNSEPTTPLFPNLPESDSEDQYRTLLDFTYTYTDEDNPARLLITEPARIYYLFLVNSAISGVNPDGDIILSSAVIPNSESLDVAPGWELEISYSVTFGSSLNADFGGLHNFYKDTSLSAFLNAIGLN